MPAPEPSPQLETFKKKDVIEILSHKKAYNACKYGFSYIIKIIIFSLEKIDEFLLNFCFSLST